MFTAIFHGVVCLGVGAVSNAVANEPASTIDFAREVLPILSDKCFVCHGPDTKDSEMLRLDSQDHATVDLGGYQAIDLQQPNQSELIARIESVDDPMPPTDSEKQLTDSERQVLKRWVLQGGEYAQHWAFIPPKKTNSSPC